MFVCKAFFVAACRLWMWSNNKTKISANKTIHTTTMRDCNRRPAKNPSMMSSVQLLLLCGLAAQNVSCPYLGENLHFLFLCYLKTRISPSFVLFDVDSWDGHFSNFSHFSNYSYLFKHHMPVCIVIIFTFNISRLFLRYFLIISSLFSLCLVIYSIYLFSFNATWIYISLNYWMYICLLFEKNMKNNDKCGKTLNRKWVYLLSIFCNKQSAYEIFMSRD